MTREQRKAVERRDADVFLEAGAGTGKTGVLVERYCAAVAEDEVGPERILAFTFTEKAAAELRHRVRRELELQAGSTEDPELAARLREAVRQLGGAWITTIHGLCRRLLATHPVAAGIDPRFRVFDQAEAGRIARAAFDRALEDFAAGSGAPGEETVAAYGIARARELVQQAFAELRSRGLGPQLPPARPRDLGAALAVLEDAAAVAAAVPGASPPQAECFAAAGAIAAGRAERLPSLAELEAIGGSDSKVAERAACFEAIRTAVAIAAEAEYGSLALEHLGGLLESFDDAFRDAKRARSGLDFEDLQLEAVALLRRSGAISSAYRERFLHILVDEFQDTNALQLGLIEELRGPHTRVFAVGDELQSIYGFRNADLDVFVAERDRFATRSGSEVMRLSGNFRSRPEIVATANVAGTAMLAGFRPLTVGREPDRGPAPGGGGAVELVVTERAGWADLIDELAGAPDGRPGESVAEARMLAGRLRALVDSGEVRLSEIVVLLRAFTHVDAFEDALERAGLRPYVVGGRGYWSQQQARDMLALLATIANPLADEPLLGALSSPACGVRPETLWLLRKAAGRGAGIWRAVLATTEAAELELEEPQRIAQIPADDQLRLTRFHALVENLRASGPRLPLETLVERAAADSGYDLAVLMADHGPRRLANVRKLMRLAREFEEVEGRDLRGFLDFAALSAEQDSEPPAAADAEEGEGVRIMTIHNAKGLEFPVVAVADLGRDLLRGGGQRPDILLGRTGEDPPRVGLSFPRPGRKPLRMFAYEQLSDELSSREEAEELRLVYVAITRARERLILSGVRSTTDHSDSRSLSALRRLLTALGSPQLDHDVEITIPAAETTPELGRRLPDPSITIRVNAPDPERARLLSRRFPALEAAPEPAGRPPLVAVRPTTVPIRPLSYSAIAEYERCGFRFHVERVLGMSEASEQLDGMPDQAPPRDRGRRIGNAVHELLRHGAENRWAPPGAVAMRNALVRNRLDPSDEALIGEISGMIDGWLGSPLCSEIRDAGVSVRPEHPFLVEIGGTVVRGSIDLLVERPAAPALLIDYKTDRLNGVGVAEKAAAYTTQRGIYAIAAADGLGVEEVEVVYLFLEEPLEPIRELIRGDRLAEARSRLAEVIGQMRGGSFPVTPDPDWPLCRDCPARSRLCPAPAASPS